MRSNGSSRLPVDGPSIIIETPDPQLEPAEKINETSVPKAAISPFPKFISIISGHFVSGSSSRSRGTHAMNSIAGWHLSPSLTLSSPKQ